MSKAQVLFSVTDEQGHKSGVDINFEHHCNKFNGACFAIENFYPRGKAYWKLYNLQLAKHMRYYEDA